MERMSPLAILIMEQEQKCIAIQLLDDVFHGGGGFMGEDFLCTSTNLSVYYMVASCNCPATILSNYQLT